MHIIIVSDGMASSRSFTLTRRHLVAFCTGLVLTVLVLSSLFYYVTLRHAAEIRLPFLRDMIASVQREQAAQQQEYLRENLDAMATRIGQFQAQMLRLESIGERVAGLAGIKPQDIRPPAQGGPLVPVVADADSLQRELDRLGQDIDTRADKLIALESQLMEQRIRRTLLPTSVPLTDMVGSGSGFGWRIDPFTGRQAMHEGIDFTAEVGTQVIASASGVVLSAERHPEYGNLVEIDHGNGFTSRYAHMSRMLVKSGQLVKRGERVGEVGSTGRSTGPHLHFEVRYRGAPQNPLRFIAAPKNPVAPAPQGIARH